MSPGRMSLMADMPEVLAIMPARGWVAVYDDGGAEPLFYTNEH